MTNSPFIAPARAQTMDDVIKDLRAIDQDSKYWAVELKALAFDTPEQAREFSRNKSDAADALEAAQQRIKTLERDNAILRARSTGAVYVCPECDIAGCRHERAALRGEDG